MEVALKQLESIYDNVLVNEWNSHDKKQFQDLLIKAKRDWDRKVRVGNLVEFIVKEPLGFLIELQEAQKEFMANHESMSLMDVLNHNFTLYKEAWYIYSKVDDENRNEDLKARVYEILNKA